MARKKHDESQYVAESTSGREQSPAIEYSFQDAIAKAVKELLESKGLYQNVAIAQDFVHAFANNECPETKLVNEFGKRPVNPIGRGGLSRGGCSPLGTPHDELPISFYLPAANLHCDSCDATTSFLGLGSWFDNVVETPYPILGEATEQVFTLHYGCTMCRNGHLVFQVRRRGFGLQLTGRSRPFRPNVPPNIPKYIKEIVQDALVAEAEGDASAAYYHLRTALEFHLKSELGAASSVKMEGGELCDQYNKLLDQRLRAGFPSIGSLYSELSAGLHTRDVDRERFKQMVQEVEDHFAAKSMFAKYKPPAAGSTPARGP